MGTLPVPGPGRPMGSPNKTSKTLKEAALEAAERVGHFEVRADGKRFATAKEGLVGYLMALALHEPKTFGALLNRILPLQVTGSDGGPLRIIDDRMTPREAAEAYAETLRAIPGLSEPNEEIDLTVEDYHEEFDNERENADVE